VASKPWSEFQTFEVMNSSDRSMPESAMARPTPASLP
jgi:hypothetical protein